MSRPHRRQNPLTGQWVLVSPQRTQRPWLGDTSPEQHVAAPHYDPQCYLCPGNKRANGVVNPQYQSTFLFDNDFPALLPDASGEPLNDNDLLLAAPERGTTRVMCFSPRHDLSIPTLDLSAIREVVDAWCSEAERLRTVHHISAVQIFENRGSMMGASNPHPHCQMWATEHVPDELVAESSGQQQYLDQHGSCLLCDYVAKESGGERVVAENPGFLAVVPFWAVWPFEVLVIAKRHHSRIGEMSDEERDRYADILGRITRGYDRLFNTEFPYSMGIHEQPRDDSPAAAWHVHTHFYPPLLRSATIRKFMVGFELLGGPQRDLTAETAAARLRVMMNP